MPQKEITSQDELNAAIAGAGVFEEGAKEPMATPPDTFVPEADKKYYTNAAEEATNTGNGGDEGAAAAAAAAPAAGVDPTQAAATEQLALELLRKGTLQEAAAKVPGPDGPESADKTTSQPGGRRRSKRRYGKKGGKKSRKSAKQSKKGGRHSSKNRRKHSHRSRKH
jgi:hypothetical protein